MNVVEGQLAKERHMMRDTYISYLLAISAPAALEPPDIPHVGSNAERLLLWDIVMPSCHDSWNQSLAWLGIQTDAVTYAGG